MNHFWEATYSGVTWIQLAIPWIGLVVVTVLAVWGFIFAISQKDRADLWVECENITRIRLNDRIDIALEDKRILIEKVKSLEAQINRLISRPRQANGRFVKGGKK